MVRLAAMTINQVIDVTIFRVATITIAFSIAVCDQESKKRTAGHEIA